MSFRSFVIFASVFAVCAAGFVFTDHRLTSLLCSSVLLLASVLLLGSDSNSRNKVAREGYLTSKTQRKPDWNGALVFQAGLTEPSPTVERTKLETVEASVFRQNASPTLRRSVSYVLPRTNYWELGFLLGDDDDERDQPFRLAERSAVDFVAQLVSTKASNGSAANLEKVPSLTAEQVNQLADTFIARFHEEMRLQRQDSEEKAWEILKRQTSYELYQAMLDRSTG